MLDTGVVQSLLEARHADPFAVLGMHADDSGQLCVRALLPGAERVTVLDAGSGQQLVELSRRHPDGFFEGPIARRRKRFDYRLRVRWQNGSEETYADAFAYGALISDAELLAFHEGRHGRPYEMLGAHPQVLGGNLGTPAVSGVRFAVWAPNAGRVSVVGNFNHWDGRRHPLRLRHPSGVWETFVPHVALGDLYKFEIAASNGVVLPLKADPYAFAAQMRPDEASRVAGLTALRALPADRGLANQRHAPISIYEVHVGSWRHCRATGFPNWRELAEQLPAYAAGLGFTHVELLPITEHPFDGSWGYQPLGLYAPTARFGSADEFAYFVERCHAHGVGVLLDWVPAHFPSDAHGLAQFDGTPLYEYGDPREGFHRDWSTLIYNYRRTEVRSFLCGSARYWLERFAVDGLRVDAVASMLYRDYSRNAGEWLPNALGGRENLEAISLFRHLHEQIGMELPGTITIAEESTTFARVSAPTYAGGLGFHYKWNMGWMNDTLRYMAQLPIHRRWHHDLMSFGLVYAFSENYVLPISHDEVVHGKGSMLGKMPGDEWQRFANLRAYYGFMWGHPGKKLLFMGQEFGQSTEWNDEESLPWQQLDDSRHLGVQRLISDLNQLYRKHTALHRLDWDSDGFKWLIGDDRENSVFAWVRYDGSGGAVIVVSNFATQIRERFRLPLPAGLRTWREALNTDSEHYGGGNVGNAGRVLRAERGSKTGRAPALYLTLPPLATVFLEPA